ncbi:MAG TPA: MATE family efflux transporter [Lachnospiraceae bacterium]|nr:MATE family efflux transporter [Lachnospiraceae bacterium]
MSKKASATLLTEGPIWKRIIAFAIPIFLGNLFQQLYNTADSLIVGNFLGSEALAAVSSSGSLIFLLVGFFNGISMGAGVVIARYFGAKDDDTVHRAVHTAIAFGITAGLSLMVIGLLLAPQMLKWMGTPQDVMVNSVIYFRVYYCGSLAFVVYNCCVGIMQSVGDSKHPLYYLIISSLTNICLDLFFVGVLHKGVGYAALATIISQFVSAALCFTRLCRVKEVYRINVREIRFDFELLKQIISNGLPSGVQNSIVALANVVVQSNINSFGKMAVAGCGAYMKLEGFGFLPVTCFSLSMATFISQNLGAKEYERAKKGARFGVICSMSLAEVIGVCVYFCAPFLVAAFNSDPEVVAYGTSQAHTIALFYCLLAFSHCVAGIMRGAGRATVPMFVMMCCWCIIRVIYITVTIHFIPKIQVVFWAYPITWTLSSLIFLFFLLKSDWVHAYDRRKIE